MKNCQKQQLKQKRKRKRNRKKNWEKNVNVRNSTKCKTKFIKAYNLSKIPNLHFIIYLFIYLQISYKKTSKLLTTIIIRGCSHDTRMSFIKEWVSFQNEVRTAFTWQNRPTQPSWKRPFYPPSLKRYACATRPRLRGLRFHHRTEFVFSLHDTRMKCHTRTRISFGLKTGMNSFRNDLCGS